MTTTTKIPTYRLLGSSALRVFPFSLGTMNFGTGEKWGAQMGLGTTEEEAEKMVLRYIEAGGNFIDTANFYHLGESEQWLAKIIKKNKIDREKLVIATKYSLPMVQGDPNAAGNNKKNMIRSLRDSLNRLELDYVDIFYVHFWDWSVNIEDLMRNLNELVVSGKVLHLGASDLPAWVVATANTIASAKGWSPFVVYQGLHSLVDRSLEQEVFPMSKHFNIATVPWAVLGQGKLTGTRTKEDPSKGGQRKISFTDSDFKIQDEVIAIAKELNKSPSQVALAWSMTKTTSPLVGCRTAKQLEDCLGALDIHLSEEQLKRLSEVSKDSPNVIFPNAWNGSSPADCGWLYVFEKLYSISL